jgi:hypothetical protein
VVGEQERLVSCQVTRRGVESVLVGTAGGSVANTLCCGTGGSGSCTANTLCYDSVVVQEEVLGVEDVVVRLPRHLRSHDLYAGST